MADSFEAELKNPAIAGLYHATKAALDFSLNKTLAEGNLSKKNANQNFDFARGNVVRQEPQRFQANRNAANSQGLAESGVLAQTQQRQAANYNQQLGGLAQQRKQAVERITSGEFNATEGRRIGVEGLQKQAKKEELDYELANPPKEAAKTPGEITYPGVAGSPTTNLPPGYTSKTMKGGSVDISPPPGAARKAAIKKIKGG